MPKVVHDGLKKRCEHSRRQWPKCGCSWHFSFFYGGKEHRHSLDVVARARGLRLARTKHDALALRDKLRDEIRDGKAVEPAAATVTPEPTTTALTFADVVKSYKERYVSVPTRRPSAVTMFTIHLNMLERAQVPVAGGGTVALKDMPIAAITKAHVEAIRTARRAELAKARAARNGDEEAAGETRKVRRPGAKNGEVGLNRLLARLRHVFAWAVEEGFVDGSPFKRGGITVIRLEHRAESPRTRRLEPDLTNPKTGNVVREGEEQRLLKHAGPHLRALIVAALNTGCRQGELLSLEWWQVRVDEHGVARELHLPATHTKTHEARVIPIGPRLRAELAMRPRHGPDGEELPATASVFGNELGEPVASIREAWEEACAAAGIQDLHFHDLRREFACRLLEAKTDLHDVREFLGHANITTTSTYLRSTSARLARALDRLDPEPTVAPPSSEAAAPDSHTIRTNQAEDTNGQPGGLAVTH